MIGFKDSCFALILGRSHGNLFWQYLFSRFYKQTSSYLLDSKLMIRFVVACVTSSSVVCLTELIQCYADWQATVLFRSMFNLDLSAELLLSAGCHSPCHLWSPPASASSLKMAVEHSVDETSLERRSMDTSWVCTDVFSLSLRQFWLSFFVPLSRAILSF